MWVSAHGCGWCRPTSRAASSILLEREFLRGECSYKRLVARTHQYTRGTQLDCAGVAKLADAQDLKSWVPKGTCGFDPRPRHQILRKPCVSDGRGISRRDPVPAIVPVLSLSRRRASRVPSGDPLRSRCRVEDRARLVPGDHRWRATWADWTRTGQPATKVPEPSSLLQFGMAVTTIAAAAIRQRRNR